MHATSQGLMRALGAGLGVLLLAGALSAQRDSGATEPGGGAKGAGAKGAGATGAAAHSGGAAKLAGAAKAAVKAAVKTAARATGAQDRGGRGATATALPPAPDRWGADAENRLTGPARNDHLGMSMAFGGQGSGDWDGDGSPDLLLGGGVSEVQPMDVWIESLVQGARCEPRGAITDLRAARGDRPALVWLGDLDGGGRDDFAVGLAGWRPDEAEWGSPGAVLVFLGESRAGAGPWGPDDADLKITGSWHERFGWSLAALDADGDGDLELAVGAPGLPIEDYHGRVYLFDVAGLLGAGVDPALDVAAPRRAWPGRAAAFAMFEGDGVCDVFGWALAGVGDTDGAPGDELLVGAPQAWPDRTSDAVAGPGYARVVAPMAPDASAVTLRPSPREGVAAQFGHAVVGLGDVDGDGHGDYAVGAPRCRRRFQGQTVDALGGVLLYSGGRPGRSLLPDTSTPLVAADLWDAQLPGTDFGWTLAALPLTDAGGRPHCLLAVSAPLAPNDPATHPDQPGNLGMSGRVYVYDVTTDEDAERPKRQVSVRQRAVFGGDTSRDRLGWSLALGLLPSRPGEALRPLLVAGANGFALGRAEETAEIGAAYLFELGPTGGARAER